MKLFYILVLILSFKCHINGQIPNPSFESWTGSQPNGWRAYSTSPFSPYVFETQVATAYQGSSALKSNILLVSPGPTLVASGVITGSQSTNFFIPISVKPTKLFGWYILQNNQDTLTVNITMKSLGSIIGTGEFKTYSLTPSYAQFTANINYTSAAVPDSFKIDITFNHRIMGSYFSSSSYFIIDDLSFDITVGQNELRVDLNDLKIFPNPTNGHLKFTSLNSDSKISEIEVFNELGRLIMSKQINSNMGQLDITEYPSGMYFFKFKLADERVFYKKTIKN